MIPSKIYRRAVEITEERLRKVLEQLHEEPEINTDLMNEAYDNLINSDQFDVEFEAFEAAFPGQFYKIAERRRRLAQGE